MATRDTVDPLGGGATATDTLNDWAALDALTFDSSLSFLDGIDGIPVQTQSSRIVVQSPPLLPESFDDSELLKDMLALAADGIKSGSAPPRKDVAAAHAEATPPLPPQFTSKSSRNRSRPKEEIDYLRVQMAELENELTRLKQRSDRVGESTGAATSSVWESIARRQASEKQRAEIENSKLRERVEGQLRVARSLEKLLRKRALTDLEPLFVERKRLRAPSMPFDLEKAAHDIHARITDQFDEVDSVFDECGLSTRTADIDDVRATTDKANAICMELTMVKTYPFAQVDVAEAVWQCLNADHIVLPDGFYAASQLSESRTDLKFAVNLRVRRSEAVIHVRGVSARRATDDRAVFVFETVGATGGPLFAGHEITCRERGYVVVERAPPSRGSLLPSTVVRACVRSWPESEGRDVTVDGTHERPQAGLFVDLVVGAYNTNVKMLLQFIENTLVSRSTQGAE